MSIEPPPNDSLAHMESSAFQYLHECVYVGWHMLMTLGFSLRLQGARNMPKTGPALIIANHQSFFDPILIGLTARRPLVYLARKTLFDHRFLAFIIRGMNAVPIDQEGVGKEGIRVVLEQLRHGKAVVIFPEGTRTADGAMNPLRPGIHLLIKRTKAPIIPVGIAGAYDAWPSSRAYPLPAPLFLPTRKGCISVSLGEPIDASRYAGMPREQVLQEMFDKIAAEKQRAEKLLRR